MRGLIVHLVEPQSCFPRPSTSVREGDANMSLDLGLSDDIGRFLRGVRS